MFISVLHEQSNFMNNPFEADKGAKHEELRNRLDEFHQLENEDKLAAIYSELLKSNNSFALEQEREGIEDFTTDSIEELIDFNNDGILSIKESVYALKSLGVFDYLKKHKGVTIDEAALLLSSITGNSFSNYRKHIASKKTAELTPHKKTNKQQDVHRTLWGKLFKKEHGNTLLPKIDPIANDKWVHSGQVTDNLSGAEPK